MGIGMSLVLTWANRIFVSSTEEELDELNIWIEDHFPRAPRTVASESARQPAESAEVPGVPAVLSVAGE
jgi:hypothetical protein